MPAEVIHRLSTSRKVERAIVGDDLQLNKIERAMSRISDYCSLIATARNRLQPAESVLDLAPRSEAPSSAPSGSPAALVRGPGKCTK